MNFIKNLWRGIIPENPIFRLVLGMCPTLAVTTAAVNGLGMGLATMAVLIGSNVVVSLLRNFIPNKVRIPAYVVIIASFTTIVGLLLKAFVPVLDRALGLFIPLIVVNCTILARAESFASKNGILDSLADAVGMGIGFTLSLTLLGSVREILGAGSMFGFSLFGASYEPALIMILPPGAFLALGLLMGLLNKLTDRKKERSSVND